MGMGSPSPPSSPAALVTDETFKHLLRANFARVRRLVRRAGVPDADEKDLIQEVFLALHLAIGRGLDVGTSLRVWLRKATYRIARDHLKLASTAREPLMQEGEFEPQDEGLDPEEHMERIDVRRLVDEVLNELPSPLRLVLVMSDADEMPMSEIAEVLEIPVGTGYSRLHAARRAFASAWRKRCEEENAPDAAALGIAPFLLFDAGTLFDVEHELPELPGGLEDQVWNRLVEALGPGFSGGGAGPAVAPTAGVAAAKGATVVAGKRAGALIATQIAVMGASALAGAGLYALIAALRAESPQATIRNDNLPVETALRRPSNASMAPLPLPSATATATTSPAADASARVDGASERNVLERAQASIARAAIAPNAHIRALELATARAALAEHEWRFPNGSLTQQRESLRKQITAYQAERQARDRGHP